MLEARPQSGFVVKDRAAYALPLPSASKPPARAASVSVAEMMLELLERSADPKLVPLGGAVPSAELLAASRLDGYLARTARRDAGIHSGYSPLLGNATLREEIARRALRWGQAIAPDDIAITSGCTEALMLALKIITSPGDTVATESPTYFGILHALEALDLKGFELPTDATTGIDVSALQRALEAGAIDACLFSSSFNNPLGCTTPDEKKRDIVRLLAKHNVQLIEDDVFGDVYLGKYRPRPFVSFDRRGNGIHCGSFSKRSLRGIASVGSSHRIASETLSKKKRRRR